MPARAPVVDSPTPPDIPSTGYLAALHSLHKRIGNPFPFSISLLLSSAPIVESNYPTAPLERSRGMSIRSNWGRASLTGQKLHNLFYFLFLLFSPV